MVTFLSVRASRDPLHGQAPRVAPRGTAHEPPQLDSPARLRRARSRRPGPPPPEAGLARGTARAAPRRRRAPRLPRLATSASRPGRQALAAVRSATTHQPMLGACGPRRRGRPGRPRRRPRRPPRSRDRGRGRARRSGVSLDPSAGRGDVGVRRGHAGPPGDLRVGPRGHERGAHRRSPRAQGEMARRQRRVRQRHRTAVVVHRTSCSAAELLAQLVDVGEPLGPHAEATGGLDVRRGCRRRSSTGRAAHRARSAAASEGPGAGLATPMSAELDDGVEGVVDPAERRGRCGGACWRWRAAPPARPRGRPGPARPRRGRCPTWRSPTPRPPRRRRRRARPRSRRRSPAHHASNGQPSVHDASQAVVPRGRTAMSGAVGEPEARLGLGPVGRGPSAGSRRRGR